MKPEFKNLKELNEKAGKYRTRVKVIHKGHPQQSPNKSRYQRVIMKDDTGYTMRGTLFGNDIEKFANIIQRKGEYELQDATVNPVPAQYSTKGDEFAMVINERATINPLITDPSYFAPEYQTIAHASKDPDSGEIIDVLGIILMVSEIRQVARAYDRTDEVQDIHLIDHSTNRPVTLSIWNDIIHIHKELLDPWAASYIVAGFQAVIGKSYKGFTLSSTMSTVITTKPEGPSADGLRQWATKHKSILTDHRSKLIDLHSEIKTAAITTLAEVNQRTAQNTWQDENFQIQVTIPTASVEHLKTYLACSKCGKSCNSVPEATFACNYCGKNDATAQPKAILKIDAVDETGSIMLTMFAREIEQLLGIPCSQLWELKEKDNMDPIAEKFNEVRAAKLKMDIGPTRSLTKNKILSWGVRSLTME